MKYEKNKKRSFLWNTVYIGVAFIAQARTYTLVCKQNMYLKPDIKYKWFWPKKALQQ